MTNIVSANNDIQTIYDAIGSSNRYSTLSPPENNEQHIEAVKATMSSGAGDRCRVPEACMIGMAAISRILMTLIETAKVLAPYL